MHRHLWVCHGHAPIGVMHCDKCGASARMHDVLTELAGELHYEITEARRIRKSLSYELDKIVRHRFQSGGDRR